MRTRQDIASAAADKLLASAATLEQKPVLVGFDGFVDSIIHVVDKRHSMKLDGFTRIRTIEHFAGRAAAAAGKSANIELVVEEDRFGGNGPLMAGGLGRAGAAVTYIGTVGRVDNPREVDPIYQPFAARCKRVIPVGPPAHTDALEFDDGKLMLGKPRNVMNVDWSSLKQSVGAERLFALFENAALIGIVNWVMMGGVESIWDGLCDEVFPKLGGAAKKKRVFLDLCDPAKRSDSDIEGALVKIRRIDALVPVTLGLNLSEAERIGAVLKLDALQDAHGPGRGQSVRFGAEAIRAKLGIDCVVIHPREGAAAANAKGMSHWFDGPFITEPKLSTGAGDHFNSGFALGQLCGMELDECLALACATSGAYVRDAQSPDQARLAAMLRAMPSPQ
jgi:sugar/nucleoside kinase (ribokinase family)